MQSYSRCYSPSSLQKIIHPFLLFRRTYFIFIFNVNWRIFMDIKKIITRTLAAALAVIMLVGCQDKGKSSEIGAGGSAAVEDTSGQVDPGEGGADAADEFDGDDVGRESDISKYKTVKISYHTWMAENLNYNARGSKCYENKPENCEKYGRLYSLEAAKKVCPEGWYLPADEDWDELVRTADGYHSAGKHLKAKSGWPEGGNGLDTYGFSALPGGSRWWSASFSDDEIDGGQSTRELDRRYDYVQYTSGGGYLSVRCVRIDAAEKAAIEAAAEAGAKEFAGEIAELEQEVKKWMKSLPLTGDTNANYEASESASFLFKEKIRRDKNDFPDDENLYRTWTATSKSSIGGCPAGSVWEIGLGVDCDSWSLWSRRIPDMAKCRFIIPPIITAPGQFFEGGCR
jgi:uncharacterized protein (TIGR02145 family)